MKEKYKIAIVESIPYMVVIIVIFLSVYLNALIVQDSITLFVAIIIGYILVSAIVGLEIFSMILLKVSEVEMAIKDEKNEELEKKVEELELELEKLKRRG